MRPYLIILFLLLILWITGSSYWYVCRLRGDCNNSPQANENISPGSPADKQERIADSLKKASFEEAKTFLAGSGTQTVYFAVSSDKTDMSVLKQDFLDKLKLYLEKYPQSVIEVTGHTDNSGTESYNKQLGSSRAGFVKSFLTGYGINAERIKASSKASGEPAATNNTTEGRAKNRRTEIKIIIQ